MALFSGLLRGRGRGDDLDSEEHSYHWRRVESLQTPVSIDSNFKGHQIAGLNNFNFQSALDEKSAAMVMFYRSCDDNLCTYMERFSQAAKCTKRENHIYAAVDCTQHDDLCREQCVWQTPVYILYSRGSKVGIFKDVEGMTAQVMRTYVENAPAVAKPTLQSTYVQPSPDRRSAYDEFRDTASTSSFR
ncbi:hypothetical protein BsWGS_17000 [Bradybaena similaris]